MVKIPSFSRKKNQLPGSYTKDMLDRGLRIPYLYWAIGASGRRRGPNRKLAGICLYPLHSETGLSGGVINPLRHLFLLDNRETA